MHTLRIEHRCLSLEGRPRVSSFVRRYFENFLFEKLMSGPKKLFRSQWGIVIVVDFQPHEMLSVNQDIQYDIFRPHVLSTQKLKVYSLFVPFNIELYPGEEMEAYVIVLFDALKAFFTSQYKRISEDYFESIREEIDYDYLLAIDYPADFCDQEFIDDNKQVQKIYLEKYLK